ncbi:MAG: hypothetical protein SGPRY_014956, partial [Prymnesium sp.]
MRGVAEGCGATPGGPDAKGEAIQLEARTVVHDKYAIQAARVTSGQEGSDGDPARVETAWQQVQDGRVIELRHVEEVREELLLGQPRPGLDPPLRRTQQSVKPSNGWPEHEQPRVDHESLCNGRARVVAHGAELDEAAGEGEISPLVGKEHVGVEEGYLL